MLSSVVPDPMRQVKFHHQTAVVTCWEWERDYGPSQAFDTNTSQIVYQKGAEGFLKSEGYTLKGNLLFGY